MHLPLLVLVRLYRWFLSPLKSVFFGPHSGCRHVPSCSAYAEEALRRHGAGRGLWLTARRVARCHPWGSSGWDPVPPPCEVAGNQNSGDLRGDPSARRRRLHRAGEAPRVQPRLFRPV